MKLYPPTSGDPRNHGKVEFDISLTFKGCFEKGWGKHSDSQCLSTFNTSQPSEFPRSRPAGMHKCDEATRDRCAKDRHRFPPYQYKETNLLWNDPVVGFLLLRLLRPRKLCVVSCLKELLACLFADAPVLGSILLTWHGLDGGGNCADTRMSQLLNSKLLTLLSTKGADVMIQASHGSRDHQRFRTSVPANLWSWRTVCGFAWSSADGDHINRLELRAVYTALRWRVLRRKELRSRLLHLTDSMVCLHVLNRGRSSSRNLSCLECRPCCSLPAFKPTLPTSPVLPNPRVSSANGQSRSGGKDEAR